MVSEVTRPNVDTFSVHGLEQGCVDVRVCARMTVCGRCSFMHEHALERKRSFIFRLKKMKIRGFILMNKKCTRKETTELKAS